MNLQIAKPGFQPHGLSLQNVIRPADAPQPSGSKPPFRLKRILFLSPPTVI